MQGKGGARVSFLKPGADPEVARRSHLPRVGAGKHQHRIGLGAKLPVSEEHAAGTLALKERWACHRPRLKDHTDTFLVRNNPVCEKQAASMERLLLF